MQIAVTDKEGISPDPEIFLEVNLNLRIIYG